jgi:hypothetical protein
MEFPLKTPKLKPEGLFEKRVEFPKETPKLKTVGF